MLVFFSYRRRHTIWPRYGSSDVCSSDLSPADAVRGLCGDGGAVRLCCDRALEAPVHAVGSGGAALDDLCRAKSEERRVGKESRSRGTPEQWNKTCKQ